MCRYCFVLFLLLSTSAVIGQTSLLLSTEFNQAIDAANARVVASSTFTNYVSNNLPLSSPTCSVSLSFPTRTPIPSTVTSLKMCYEDALGIEQVWIGVYQLIGNSIISQLNSQYNLQLTTSFVLINTTENGFFTSMSNAVRDGLCDVV